jgi:multidrug resistance efflux pump
MSLINWNSKITRRLFALLILAVAALVIVPALFVEQSFNAIINGRTISLHSPVEGTLNLFNKEVGDPVRKYEAIVAINNIRLNASFRKELEVERNTLQDRVLGFDKHIAELRRIRGDLSTRLSNTKDYENRRIDKQILEQEYELAAQHNVLANYQRLHEIQSRFIKSGSISTIEYENTVTNVAAAKNRIQSLEQRIGALKIEKQALANGVFLGQGRNDVPYNQQKIDELDVQISDYASRKIESQRRIKEITDQIMQEDGRLTLNRTVDITSPVDGIIWKKYHHNLSEVQIGSEVLQIVDCSRLFLEVEVNENSLSKIDLGTQVKYRIRNSDNWLMGKITSKSGSGRILQDNTLAAELLLERTQAKIIVTINPGDLEQDNRNFCHIGRKVEVIIPRDWVSGVWWSRLKGVLRWN